jgi:hypothetical protein
MKYQLVLLDVWGNEEDGFEVNDISKTQTFIEIPDASTDDEIMAILEKNEIIRPVGVSVNDIWYPDIFIDDAKTGKPIIRLDAINREGE